MDQKYCAELARIRLERAIELLDESEDLLKKEKYKSANNRSFYAMEKAIKALLAMKGVLFFCREGDEASSLLVKQQVLIHPY